MMTVARVIHLIGLMLALGCTELPVEWIRA